MARSLSAAKFIAAAAAASADGLSLSIFRRGLAAAAPQGWLLYGSEGSRVGMMGKVDQRVLVKPDSEAASAWAPDPVTGYYRPQNCADKIDPAELRAMLLNQKVRPH